MNHTKGTISEHRCLKCRRHYSVTKFHQIDIDEDFEVLNKLLAGELFTFVCPFCSEEYIEAYSLMVHSYNLKYQVYWFEEAVEREEFIKELEERRLSQNEEDDLYSYILELETQDWKIRVVDNYFDLLEKIDIFTSGYHDGPIEMLKVLMAYTTIDENEDWTALHFSSRINEKVHAVYGFVENEVRFGIDFQKESYDELWEEFSEECMKRQYFVDMSWAQATLDYHWGDEE